MPVEMQLTYGPGLPVFHMVGMVTESTEEAKERVRYALKSIGRSMPQGRVVVAFLPSELTKSGSHFDLAIVYGFVKGSSDRLIVGEVALDGSVRTTQHSLRVIASAYRSGWRKFICPVLPQDVVGVMPEADFFMVEHVQQLLSDSGEKPSPTSSSDVPALDAFEDVQGFGLKQAALTAAAGWHHLLLMGNPGVGKTMVAERMNAVMPELDNSERLDVLCTTGTLSAVRPYRFTSWTSTPAGFFGSAKGVAGEVTLAHDGILVMDEFPQYRKDILEGLRTVMDTNSVISSYGNQRIVWPARFLLVATSNPCPCGFLGHPKKVCKDSPYQVQRYLGRLSGPVADRIDLHYWVKADEPDAKLDKPRDRVLEVWHRQRERWQGTGFSHAGQIPGDRVDELISVSPTVRAALENAVEKHGLSKREKHKIIRISRTIADLEGHVDITVAHLVQALSYRMVLPWLRSLIQ
ncbi:ATP-binding protein [Coprothermobacteraceae bacterium]|nr:ATP-binding protein [Coprothermobacteraceae bacterium]